MKRNVSKVLGAFLISAALLSVGLLFSNRHGQSDSDKRSLIQAAEKNLHRAERIANQLADSLASISSSPNIQLEGFTNQTNFALIFRNKELIAWSDNRIAFKTDPDLFLDRTLIRYRNGWFEPFVRDRGEIKVVVLLLIKNEYSFQNKYLGNNFNPDWELPSATELCAGNTKECLDLQSENGHPLCSIDLSKNPANSGWGSWLLVFCYIGFGLSFGIGVHFLGRILSEGKNKYLGTTLFFVGLTGISILSTVSQFPGFLYAESLFNPSYFASSTYLSSLGNLLLYCVLGFYMISFLYKRFRLNDISQKISGTSKTLLLTASALVSVQLLTGTFILNLLRSLILNSSISFDVINIFSLDSFSLYSFLVIGLLFSGLFLIYDAGSRFLIGLKMKTSAFILTTILGTLLFVGLMLPTEGVDFSDTVEVLILALLLTLLCTLYYQRISVQRQFAFSQILPAIILFSIIAGINIYTLNDEKEKTSRISLAIKLNNQRDHIAEHLFEEMKGKIIQDSVVSAILDTSSSRSLETGIRRLHQIYFNGYWSKYDSKLHVYDRNKNPIFNSNNENVGLDYFARAIVAYGSPALSQNLFFLSGQGIKTGYIAELQLSEINDSLSGTLIVELDSKPLHEDSRFPDLLLSSEVAGSNTLIPTGYSYALYQNSKLIFRHGAFPYYAIDSVYDKGEIGFSNLDNYSHYSYSSTPTSRVVVSREEPVFSDFLTLISYLFAFFSVFLFVLSALRQLPVMVGLNVVSSLSFSGKFQRLMLLIVFVSLSITATITALYIVREFNSDQKNQIRQRTASLLLAVQSEINNLDQLQSDALQNMTYTLMNLSQSSGMEFNLYDLQGNMLFSTQPKIYEQALVSEKMSSTALYAFMNEKKSAFLNNEHIGNLRFAAAYETLSNNDHKTIGYLGIPFFTNETELKREISSFIVSLVNICVLLFALAIILSFAAGERITRPLKIIRQKIGQTRIDGKNEPLKWDADDEIGELVNEYNRMVKELEGSAARLAKSEREGAWREMAKQVAHEIKNPLTPMKLSIQYLQKAWNEQSPEMDSILKKISQTIIQQIDTLSSIASEFSNFAQMPKPSNEKVSLAELLQQSVDLFAENESTVIQVENNTTPGALIFADRDQVSRVFKNILVNALESIPEGIQKKIDIRLDETNAQIVVSITDNGEGIPPSIQPKIFEPNFTTKTSGMGLGLAMVKNIMVSCGGEIHFKTSAGEGTTFFLHFPKIG